MGEDVGPKFWAGIMKEPGLERERGMKLRYAVVFERSPNNYAAYVPDVPGCVSTGTTWDEMLAMIREALAFHIEAMLEDGESVPEPRTSIGEAIAKHSEPIREEVLDAYREFGEPAQTISTRFEMVEIEVPVPQAVQAG